MVQAVCNVIRLQLIATIHRKAIAGQVAVEAMIGGIEIAQTGANHAAGCIAAARHQLREIGLFLFVDYLPGKAHITRFKFLGQAQADLATRNRVVTGIAIIATLLEMAAEVEIEIIGQVGAIFGINAIVLVIDAQAERDRTAAVFAGLANQVDDAAGAVGGQRRSRTAANRFHTSERRIGFVETVSGGEKVVTEQEDRKAVFLHRQELCATGRDRNTANVDVGVAAARRAFRTNAGQLAEYFCEVCRIAVSNCVCAQ